MYPNKLNLAAMPAENTGVLLFELEARSKTGGLSDDQATPPSRNNDNSVGR